MIGEIIAVGEEVLAGDTLNSNAATISRALAEVGVFCRIHTVVGDIEETIIDQMSQAMQRADVIVLCGGLGPTKDDLTKESVAHYFGYEMYEDPNIRQGIEERFAHRGITLTENNFKQALVIEHSKSIPNPNGTAPGVYIEKDGKLIFLLPGPPSEMQPMLTDFIVPEIKTKSDLYILTKSFHLIGIGESAAVTLIDDIIQAGDRVIVAPYAKTNEVHIKVTIIDEDREKCESILEPIEAILKERLGQYIYSEDGRELVEVVLDRLRDKKAKLATAESCTGGLLGAMLVDIPGASDVYEHGVITYSNASKVQLLDVSEKDLEDYGAVSSEVARDMVQGLKNTFNSDYGISITGIAGPGGGTKEKPLGLVYIGLLTPQGIQTFRHQFFGNRKNIRERSAKMGLIHLMNAL